jgi:predicted ATPase
MPNSWFDIRVKERHNNQYTSINSVSTGCKKILYVLSVAVAASLNGVQLLMFEELENSVHPRLLQSLLQVVTTLAGDTRVMTTSHSPFLVKYLRPERIWLGLPSSEGVANFRTIKSGKVKRVLQLASGEDTSVGEYLFEMMLDAEAEPEMLDEFFV